ncbi:MAG: CPBP family intramembrane metalloprotease [Candidatus Hydrothermae bacterium]|nr:CPBP family intramembrane metalloprotease [Candidatus Hydrothermae bacterium]
MARLRWLKRKWLLGVTSLGFALWHGNPLLFPHTLLVGLLFGWVYLKEGRLLPVIMAHSLTNVIGGVLMLTGWM